MQNKGKVEANSQIRGYEIYLKLIFCKAMWESSNLLPVCIKEVMANIEAFLQSQVLTPFSFVSILLTKAAVPGNISGAVVQGGNGWWLGGTSRPRDADNPRQSGRDRWCCFLV